MSALAQKDFTQELQLAQVGVAKIKTYSSSVPKFA
jgi:hypothetical protein